MVLVACSGAGAWVALYWHLSHHEEGWVSADPSRTPDKVVPEWFFLPYFGVLKSIPTKGVGIVAIVVVLVLLVVAPFNVTLA